MTEMVTVMTVKEKVTGEWIDQSEIGGERKEGA